jgi:hypothetical protein
MGLSFGAPASQENCATSEQDRSGGRAAPSGGPFWPHPVRLHSPSSCQQTAPAGADAVFAATYGADCRAASTFAVAAVVVNVEAHPSAAAANYRSRAGCPYCPVRRTGRPRHQALPNPLNHLCRPSRRPSAGARPSEARRPALPQAPHCQTTGGPGGWRRWRRPAGRCRRHHTAFAARRGSRTATATGAPRRRRRTSHPSPAGCPRRRSEGWSSSAAAAAAPTPSGWAAPTAASSQARGGVEASSHQQNPAPGTAPSLTACRGTAARDPPPGLLERERRGSSGRTRKSAAGGTRHGPGGQIKRAEAAKPHRLPKSGGVKREQQQRRRRYEELRSDPEFTAFRYTVRSKQHRTSIQANHRPIPLQWQRRWKRKARTRQRRSEGNKRGERN